MARSTGIEITETSVRVVDVDGSARKFRVLGAANVPIPVNDDGVRGPDQVQQAVRGAMKAAKARRELVVLGIPASRAVIREIVVPFTETEQIKKVIKFESESHLPTGNIEDVVVGFHKISESGPRSRLLIVAVQKSTLQEYLDVLARGGIDPSQVDIDAAALFSRTRLLPGLDGEDETVSNVILDVGDATTTVLVGTGAHLRMVRSIRLGADTLTRTLSQDLGIDRTEAKTVTQQILGAELPFATAGEAEAGEPSTTRTAVQLRRDIIKDKGQDLARRIVNEVHRSLSSVQLEGRIAGIWLTGTTSTVPGLERDLGEAFRVPVRPLDTLHGADHHLPPQAALFTGVPIGLALKGLDHDPLRFDFRQEEFRFTRRFERVRNPLLFAAALLLVLLCFLTITEYNQHREKRQQIEYIARIGKQHVEELVVSRAKDPAKMAVLGFATPQAAVDALSAIEKVAAADQMSRMLNLLREPIENLKKSYGVTFGDEDTSLSPELEARSALYRLDQFLSVFNRLQSQLGKYTLSRLEASSTSIRWTMQVQKIEGVSQLKDELLKLKECTGGDIGKVSTRGDMQIYENAFLEFEPER